VEQGGYFWPNLLICEKDGNGKLVAQCVNVHKSYGIVGEQFNCETSVLGLMLLLLY